MTTIDSRWLWSSIGIALSLILSVPVPLAAADDVLETFKIKQRYWRVAFDSTGKLIIGVRSEGIGVRSKGIAEVMEIASGKILGSVIGHSPAPHPFFKSEPAQVWMTDATMNPDGTMLATTGTDGVVVLWNWKTGKEKQRLEGHKVHVWRVVFSPDGKTIATGGHNGDVKLWDIESGKCSATLTGHKMYIKQMAFSRDGRWLATGDYGAGATVIAWNVAKSEQQHKWLTRSNAYSLAFSADSKRLACGTSYDGYVWDMETGKQLWYSRGEHVSAVILVGFLDSETIVTGSQDQLVYRDLNKKGELIAKRRIHQPGGDDWDSAAVSPDLRLLALPRSNENVIRLIEIPLKK
jgi:WD40 repeat protein